MMSGDSEQDGTFSERSDMKRTRGAVVEVALGLLAWVLVLGLGFSFSLMARVTTWRVILPVEFALLGLVVLVAILSTRKSK